MIGNKAKPGKVIPEMTVFLPVTTILPNYLLQEPNESMQPFAKPINYKFKVNDWSDILNRPENEDFCLEKHPSIKMQIFEKIVVEKQ